MALVLDSRRDPERRCARCCHATIGTWQTAGSVLPVCHHCADELQELDDRLEARRADEAEHGPIDDETGQRLR
jgi:hypothetical protein